MADLDFTGKRVLVIGGSSGIGNGIVRAFLDRGAELAVWGTRASAADYADEPGSDLSGVAYAQVDVARPELVEAAMLPFDGLDILVQSQGIALYGKGEFQLAGFQQVMEVNLNSMMTCALRFRDQLTQARGSMILISSAAAFRTTLGNPAYNASKAGILGLTRSLAAAWIPDGVRVNGVAPGLVDTKLTKVTIDNPKRLEASLERIPSRRLGLPSDIAGAVLYLASPLADFVIGQTISVDGGGSL